MPERKKNTGTVKRVRRKRDPEGTREAILEAAREVLAQDGKEGLSVAQVAQRAGVNRGTAYQHFQTREQLIEATATWVSEKLYEASFGDPENPGLGRVWLFELLSSRRPASDLFWRQYESNFESFAKTEYAQPGIDAEVASVLTIAGCFLWPVWTRAHTRSAKDRKKLAERFAREIIRMSLHGTLRPERYAELDAKVSRGKSRRKTKA